MNRKDIIRMAQEAGLWEIRHSVEMAIGGVGELERFVTLVASAERERLTDAAMKSAEKAVDVAIALEREACAKVADELVGQDLEHNFSALIAHNIRARGQA